MNKTKTILILSVTAIFVLAFYVILQPHPGLERKFTKLIGCQMPPSARSIETAQTLAMDSSFIVLHFEIASNDMARIMPTLQLSELKPEEMKTWDNAAGDFRLLSKGEYLKAWEEKIKRVAGIKLSIPSQYQVYASESNGISKHLFTAIPQEIEKSVGLTV